MSATSTPCEMRALPDHIAVILYPAITEASWSEVEAFGTDVRRELEARHKPACLVDLSPLNYMGSALVALILRLWKVVKARGGNLVVVCPHPVVLDVIKLAGLENVLTVAPEVEAGQKKLGVRARELGSAPAAVLPAAAVSAPSRPMAGAPPIDHTPPPLISPLLTSRVSAEPTPRQGSHLASFVIGMATVLVALLVAWWIINNRSR